MIALDVMGGDHAPEEVIRGALLAARSGVKIALFGPEQLVKHFLHRFDEGWGRYALTIVDAPDHITMNDEPVRAVTKKQQSSLFKAVASVKSKQCRAVVSAGNSGALMVAALLLLGKHQGMQRPAIASFLPAVDGHRILALDLGANTECRAEHLYEFAHCARSYLINGGMVKDPRIALLANGHEDGKGSQVTKQAYELLKKSELNFVGNCEPYTLLQDAVDIIVCDGFAGNVLLKTLETSFKLCAALACKQGQEIADTIGQIEAALDYRSVGGALLLGVQGHVMVCHGGSDAQAINNALCAAALVATEKNYWE